MGWATTGASCCPFEEQARTYLAGAQAELPLSANPLQPVEAQLVHRYLHDAGVPTYHSVEYSRESAQ